MEKIVEYWDEEKTKIKVEYFLNENGNFEGLCKSYYKNGNPEYKINYRDGKYDGVFEAYYPNGNLRYKGDYKDGKAVGLSKFYHEDGTLMYKELHILQAKIEFIKSIIKTLLLNLKKIIKR